MTIHSLIYSRPHMYTAVPAQHRTARLLASDKQPLVDSIPVDALPEVLQVLVLAVDAVVVHVGLLPHVDRQQRQSRLLDALSHSAFNVQLVALDLLGRRNVELLVLEPREGERGARVVVRGNVHVLVAALVQKHPSVAGHFVGRGQKVFSGSLQRLKLVLEPRSQVVRGGRLLRHRLLRQTLKEKVVVERLRGVVEDGGLIAVASGETQNLKGRSALQTRVDGHVGELGHEEALVVGPGGFEAVGRVQALQTALGELVLVRQLGRHVDASAERRHAAGGAVGPSQSRLYRRSEHVVWCVGGDSS